MAALPYSLSAAGDPTLTVLGMSATVVDAALMAHMGGRVEHNREQLARETDERIDRLEERARLNDVRLESAEYHALVFQTAVAAAQESEDEKIKWYAAILAGDASLERPVELNTHALLSSITFLTADELRLARAFYEDFAQKTYSIVDGALAPRWGPDTSLYLRRLETANLIVPHFVSGLPGGLQGQSGNYFVTDTFHRLMALVRETE